MCVCVSLLSTFSFVWWLVFFSWSMERVQFKPRIGHMSRLWKCEYIFNFNIRIIVVCGGSKKMYKESSFARRASVSSSYRASLRQRNRSWPTRNNHWPMEKTVHCLAARLGNHHRKGFQLYTRALIHANLVDKMRFCRFVHSYWCTLFARLSERVRKKKQNFFWFCCLCRER